MQKSDRNLQKSILDMMQVQSLSQIHDPALNSASQIVYSNEHSFEIHIQEKQESVMILKEPEMLRVKIMVEYQHGSVRNLKIQLTSDTQIYFNFIFQCNDLEFTRIKATQSFFIEFRQYPDFIIKNFQKLATHQKYIATLTIFSETDSRLDLIRKSQFKDDVIMYFDFVRAPQQQIRKSIQYRYDMMRHQYKQYKSRYDSVCDTIKQKNPSLAIQIQKLHKK